MIFSSRAFVRQAATMAGFGGTVGRNLFFDKLSHPDSMSCASCHGPKAGWTGPIAGINRHGAVYRGAVPQRFGNRKPPIAAMRIPGWLPTADVHDVRR